MSFKVLAINTYGGSLLLGAKLAGFPIVASFEDAGFGSDLQALNFPEVPLFKTKAEWPVALLRDTIVLAHPPCAAFSNQNQNQSARGTGANSFQCHVDVMNYALGQQCAALAIESVPGAFKTAKAVYELHAEAFGYNCFYFFQNAAAFGVPQWRPRFWVWFLKKDRLQVGLPLIQARTIRSVLNPEACAATDPGTYKKRVRARPGLARVLEEVEDTWKGPLLSILEEKYKMPREDNFMNVRERFGLKGLFTTCLPRFVDPDDFATTILEDSWWWVGKRELTVEEYCGIMGFPPDYKWGAQKDHFRKFLSKGVCPPVAAWVCDQILINLLDQTFPNKAWIQPNQVVDFSISRETLLEESRYA